MGKTWRNSPGSWAYWRPAPGVRNPAPTGFGPGTLAVLAKGRMGRSRGHIRLAVPWILREV